MTDRIFVPLADGRWLSLTSEQFAEAEQAGQALRPASTSTYQSRDQEDQLLTAEQLEQRTNVPASWWQQAARERRIPYARVGRYVRFRFAEVAEHFSVVPESNTGRSSRGAVTKRRVLYPARGPAPRNVSSRSRFESGGRLPSYIRRYVLTRDHPLLQVA
jgi:excisionase family DNA binding protein